MQSIELKERTDELAIFAEVDRAVASAAWSYLQHLHRRGEPIMLGRWLRELDWLRSGRDPDYEMPGLPLMYALRYMPRRTISTLGALQWSDVEYESVLDIGTGTGAAPLAVGLHSALGSRPNVRAIEPSREMLEFAKLVDYGKATVRFDVGAIGAELPAPAAARYDMVMISAALPFSFSGWDNLTELLAEAVAPSGGVVLGVLPGAKDALVDRFRGVLRRLGLSVDVVPSRPMLDRFKEKEEPLDRLTRVWRRLGEPGEPPRALWSQPTDIYILGSSK